MKTGKLHTYCAYPVIITWGLGAFVLNAAIFTSIFRDGSLSATLAIPQLLWTLPLLFLCITALGYFLGMFSIWPLVRKFCSRYNGGPVLVGDQVQILIGPRKGHIALVYEVTIGQGGWELARLDLGQESKKAFSDIYEVYSILRINRGEQVVAHQPA